MTTVEAARLIGPGVDRVDGPRKVTGSAPYSSDFSHPEMAHAVLARATVAAGRIRGIESAAAEAAPGVLAVITHRDAPRLHRAPDTRYWRQPPPPFQDDRIFYYGQHVGVVVAETAEQASAAAASSRSTTSWPSRCSGTGQQDSAPRDARPLVDGTPGMRRPRSRRRGNRR